MQMLSNLNATAIAKKYCYGSKGSFGLNDGRRRRRRRRKKPVPRAAAGYARQLKIHKKSFLRCSYVLSFSKDIDSLIYETKI